MKCANCKTKISFIQWASNAYGLCKNCDVKEYKRKLEREKNARRNNTN